MGEVTYRISRTWQVRQFEPLTVDLSMTEEVGEDETAKDAWKRVFSVVDAAFANRSKLVEDDSD